MIFQSLLDGGPDSSDPEVVEVYELLRREAGAACDQIDRRIARAASAPRQDSRFAERIEMDCNGEDPKADAEEHENANTLEAMAVDVAATMVAVTRDALDAGSAEHQAARPLQTAHPTSMIP